MLASLSDRGVQICGGLHQGFLLTRIPCVRKRRDSVSWRKTAGPMPAVTRAAMLTPQQPPQRSTLDIPFPPHAPLAGCEPGSFAEATIKRRLPSILGNAIRDLETLYALYNNNEARLSEVESAASQISALRDEMLANQPLAPLFVPPAPLQMLPGVTPASHPEGSTTQCPTDDSAQDTLSHCVSDTNAALETWRQHSGETSWLTLPWLLVECYMYVRLATIMQAHRATAAYDLFERPKNAAFAHSLSSVTALAADVLPLVLGAGSATAAEARMHVYAVMQYALWGNKTDLSLVVDPRDLAQHSLSELAAAARPQQRQRGSGEEELPHPFLIADDFEQLWAHLTSPRLGQDEATAAPVSGDSGSGRAGPRLPLPRIDIVLDNSGLELYADLCLADTLLAFGVADRIVLHGKPISWFVSDTLAGDLEALLATCEASTPPPGVQDPQAWRPVQALALRWRDHIAAGRFSFQAAAFWCTPGPMCWMPVCAEELYAEMQRESSLLILKGDLNYRKLTFDCRWPWTTPFPESLIGFRPCPLFSLRTLKADVVTGLQPGQGEALALVDPEWQINGKFGVMQLAL